MKRLRQWTKRLRSVRRGDVVDGQLVERVSHTHVVLSDGSKRPKSGLKNRRPKVWRSIGRYGFADSSADFLGRHDQFDLFVSWRDDPSIVAESPTLREIVRIEESHARECLSEAIAAALDRSTELGIIAS